MPYNPDKDPAPFATDEEARAAALNFISKLGRVIGHLLPHRSKPITNDEGERIGVIYYGTRGKCVKMRIDDKPTAYERSLGITRGYDIDPEGLESTHFVSTQRRRKRGKSNG